MAHLVAAVGVSPSSCPPHGQQLAGLRGRERSSLSSQGLALCDHGLLGPEWESELLLSEKHSVQGTEGWADTSRRTRGHCGAEAEAAG